jgi:hypothetical protein
LPPPGSSAWGQDAKPPTPRTSRPRIIRELYTGMSDDRKKAVVLPINALSG